MQRAPTPSLLLEVWREVCRHLEIDESLERLAPILAQTLPVRRVLVRRVEAESRRLITVACGGAALASGGARRELAVDELARVGEWLRAGRVQSWAGGARDALRELLAPAEMAGAIVAGPLVEGGQPV